MRFGFIRPRLGPRNLPFKQTAQVIVTLVVWGGTQLCMSQCHGSLPVLGPVCSYSDPLCSASWRAGWFPKLLSSGFQLVLAKGGTGGDCRTGGRKKPLLASCGNLWERLNALYGSSVCQTRTSPQWAFQLLHVFLASGTQYSSPRLWTSRSAIDSVNFWVTSL